MWKNAGVQKTTRLNHDETKKQLIESMVVHEVIESEELNKQEEKVRDPKEAADVIKQYEDIIRTKKKVIKER